MFELKGSATDAKIFADVVENEAISQVQGLCNHEAFKGSKIRIMPDVHSGEGCTIGTTMHVKEKIVIPSIVGCDLSCGVYTTIFQTNNLNEELDFKKLDDFIVKNIPNGLTIRNEVHKDMNKDVIKKISELNSKFKIGDTEAFLKSCGTLGGGNHYIEIGRVKTHENMFALSIHSGSRNLGKRTYEYFQKLAMNNYDRPNELVEELEKKKKELRAQLLKEGRKQDIEKELKNLVKKFSFEKKHTYSKKMACISDKDFDEYIECLVEIEKFANESRRLMSKDILEFLDAKIIEQFDTTHNYIELLEDGSIMIRKGAISAKKGEKVSIPLSMKDGVILAVGKGNEDWNCSAPHGAGRLMSRSKAKENVSLDEFKKSMKGIYSWSVCDETLDESPQAYKDAGSIVSLVEETVDILDIIKPCYNFKAHAKTKSFKEIKMEEKQRKRLEKEQPKD